MNQATDNGDGVDVTTHHVGNLSFDVQQTKSVLHMPAQKNPEFLNMHEKAVAARVAAVAKKEAKLKAIAAQKAFRQVMKNHVTSLRNIGVKFLHTDSVTAAYRKGHASLVEVSFAHKASRDVNDPKLGESIAGLRLMDGHSTLVHIPKGQTIERVIYRLMTCQEEL